MKTCKITVMKVNFYKDLKEKYENNIEHACGMKEGEIFYSYNQEKPNGFCDSAWEIIFPFLTVLANGGGNFYDGWMKNPYSAMISCNDGFRPVSFLVEALDEVEK